MRSYMWLSIFTRFLPSSKFTSWILCLIYYSPLSMLIYSTYKLCYIWDLLIYSILISRLHSLGAVNHNFIRHASTCAANLDSNSTSCHDISLHDMTWYDMTWHDMPWHGMAWHDINIIQHAHNTTRHNITHNIILKKILGQCTVKLENWPNQWGSHEGWIHHHQRHTGSRSYHQHQIHRSKMLCPYATISHG